VTIRQLNRSWYNNTIRDLVSVDFQPAADFPADDSGYDFDNSGDVLTVSPVLLNISRRRKIMNSALKEWFTNSATYQRLVAPGEITKKRK
jgi:hypothetical protein